MLYSIIKNLLVYIFNEQYNVLLLDLRGALFEIRNQKFS